MMHDQAVSLVRHLINIRSLIPLHFKTSRISTTRLGASTTYDRGARACQHDMFWARDLPHLLDAFSGVCPLIHATFAQYISPQHHTQMLCPASAHTAANSPLSSLQVSSLCSKTPEHDS